MSAQDYLSWFYILGGGDWDVILRTASFRADLCDKYTNFLNVIFNIFFQQELIIHKDKIWKTLKAKTYKQKVIREEARLFTFHHANEQENFNTPRWWLVMLWEAPQKYGSKGTFGFHP